MKANTMGKKAGILEFIGRSTWEDSFMVWQNVIHNLLTFLHFYLAILGYVPLWTFCIAVFFYIPSWMIALHEMQHIFKAKDAPLLVDLNLLILTPFSLGFREMQDIHMRHHGYTATPKDPEYYHIRGSYISGFINVLFSPEQSVYFWIREKGISPELIKGMAIRFLIFTAMVCSLGMDSFWYFIPVRLAYGSCLFLFSYCLHRKAGEFGTFQVPYPYILEKIMTVIYGRTLYYSIRHHDIHHDYPKIPGANLAAARPYYIPKRSAKRAQSNS